MQGAPARSEEEKAFFFPQGLFGFPTVKRFIIADVPGGGDVVKQMIALDEPDLAFTLVDPFAFFPGYEPDIPEADLEELGVTGPGQVVVMAIVNVPDAMEEATANLKAPVVFSPHTRRARQVILSDERYTTRHRLFPRK